MDDNTVILRNKKITIGDVKKATSKRKLSKAELSRKIGVSERYIYEIDFDKYGLGDRIKLYSKKSHITTKEKIKELGEQGYLKKDAASELNVSYRHFIRLVEKYGLKDLYHKTKREITKISQEGYFYED